MKKLLLSLTSWILFSAIAFSQAPFWTEDFGTGCNQALLATSYASPNGAWTVTNTGFNVAAPNQWFVSAMERNTGAGNCGISGCSTNRTLHLGNPNIAIAGITADQGAAYYEGLDGFCGFFPCGSTDKRIESPLIDCTGQTSVEIDFLYIEAGNTIDNGSIWYFDGTTWALLENTPKTPTTCAPQGTWTARTLSLPSSAENNPGIKIGFRWVNNDDGDATDPSFAVDDIVLSGIADTGSPVAVCQDITVSLGPGGTVSITTGDIDNGSSDDVGITSMSLDIEDFDCSSIGANEVVLTVSDIDGNSASCTATVTVVDDSDPIAVCQNIELELDEDGNGSITAEMLDGGSSDNCGIASFSANITVFTELNAGPNAIVLTVTDVNGNTSTCGAIVTVVEFEPPCIYDLNQDGIVNTGDLSLLLSVFGTGAALGDFNGDEVVNSGDLVAFLVYYGTEC